MKENNDDKTQENLENRMKNVLTLTNQKRPPRKFINITPLPLHAIRKELEEDDEDSTQLTELKDEKKSPNQTKVQRNLVHDFPDIFPIQEVENEVDSNNKIDENKVGMEGGTRTTHKPVIKTPGKFNSINRNVTNLKTPADNHRNLISFRTPARATFNNTKQESLKKSTNFTTPSMNRTKTNDGPPKIQCTIDMKTVLNTPINRICKPINCTPRVIHSPNILKKHEPDILEKEKPNLLNDTIEENLRKISVNNDEYLVLNELGKGGSSEVLHCYSFSKKVQRAIKCVSLQNPSSVQGFIDEVSKLKQLQHCDRVIKMFDYEINRSENILLVVLEVGGADLAKILKESAAADPSYHIPLYKLIQYWMEMLLAVQQIHANGIIHADLKPANFLIVDNCLKVIDFGISTSVQGDMTSVIKPVAEGSVHYMSPEALMNEAPNPNSPSKPKEAKYKISFKSDVWSLGCILYQLVYKKTPFQHVGSSLWQKLAAICDPHHVIEYPEADWIPGKIIQTIRCCLQYDKRPRPAVKDLLTEYESAFQNL